jgi:D-alanyl-D-alanine carboxypeptidase/D-alanyl-D-alanine-endopeptidase (penicillin-binding protein 4)
VFRVLSLAFALGTLLTGIPATAQLPEKSTVALAKQLDAVIDGPEYKHASWAALVVNAETGETVYERNPETMLAPASVTKLFSCAAALVALGEDSTTETAIYQRGLVLDGTLRGDLILVAAGDLTFGGRAKDGKTVFRDKDHTYANSGLGDAELTDTDPLTAINSLARQIKGAGINQIDGEVLIDDRLFSRTRGSGSGPDTITPMFINDNAIDILIEPGEKEGDLAKVTARPESTFYQMDALVTTGSAKSTPSIQLTPVTAYQFAVRGKVPAGGKAQVRIYPVEEPALLARALLIEALRRNGVRATAAIPRPGATNLPPRDAYAKMPKVAAYVSPPFKEAITVTLKVSHNLYASTLPCLIAAARGFSTLESGLREERKILKELGVNVNQVSFGGGAGGASADYVTPRATIQLLQGMSKRSEWATYKSALPLLGVDGTLADTVPATSPARGKVSAKTGTLVWLDAANDRFLLKSKALAGTMTTKAGTPLFLAFYVNNVPLPDGVGVTREGKALGKLCEILYEAGP